MSCSGKSEAVKSCNNGARPDSNNWRWQSPQSPPVSQWSPRMWNVDYCQLSFSWILFIVSHVTTFSWETRHWSGWVFPRSPISHVSKDRKAWVSNLLHVDERGIFLSTLKSSLYFPGLHDPRYVGVRNTPDGRHLWLPNVTDKILLSANFYCFRGTGTHTHSLYIDCVGHKPGSSDIVSSLIQLWLCYHTFKDSAIVWHNFLFYCKRFRYASWKFNLYY